MVVRLWVLKSVHWSTAPHILVGTPGRILDHLERGRIDLSELNTLVLDEADRMLDMGFQDALDAIISEVPKRASNLAL